MALLLAVTLLATATQAAAPAEPNYGHHGQMQDMTCPVGGERFRALQSDMYSTYGSRPDGRPNTYWFMPLPIPECPSNGLVIFDEFTPAQIVALTPLIASAEYRRLIAEDSTYYRAQWLATRIGRPEREALGLLLAASWQVKPAAGQVGQPLPSAQKARQYQEEFVTRVRALPMAPADNGFIALYARAANAARELGRFDSAQEMARQIVEWVPEADENGWRGFASRLAGTAARGDDSLQPLDLVHEREAAQLCLSETLPQSEFNRSYCARPELQDEIEQVRRARALHRRTN